MQRGPLANGPLMARPPSTDPQSNKAQRSENLRTWAFLMRAGDGNRTRTVSLGICRTHRQTGPDLGCGGSVSDREYPLFTRVNGPLMARNGVPDLHRLNALVLPVPSQVQDPLGRGRRVQARAATACGLALTRRTRPGQSCAEGKAPPQPPTASNPRNRGQAGPERRTRSVRAPEAARQSWSCLITQQLPLANDGQ